MVVLQREGREAAERRRNHVPGEPGIWLLIFGDMSVFAVLFGAYLHARSQQPDVFADSQSQLNPNFGAINTLILLTSSLLVVWATTCMRARRHRRSAGLVMGAIVLGACFIGVKSVEYHEQLSRGNTLSTNTFFSYYYILTGLHLAHLILGLLVLGGLVYLLKRPTSDDVSESFFEGGACVWHMVDLLWIAIFPLIFLVR